MEDKKSDKSRLKNPEDEDLEDVPQDDVIATIHVLKDKKHVKKRVVVRNSKNNEKRR